jgi:hypothetical protein
MMTRNSESERKQTLKERIDFIVQSRTLRELIEDRNRYDSELSLKTNLHLFDEDWMFVEKKVDVLISEIQNLREYIDKLFSLRLYGNVIVPDNVPEYFKADVEHVHQEIIKELNKLLGLFGVDDKRIRKVKVLQDKLRIKAEKQGFSPEDLVIIDGDSIERIDGDPVSYLLNRVEKEDVSDKK